MVKDTWKLDVVFWPNKVVKEIRIIDDKNSLHGPYKSFFDNHQPHIKGNYDDEGEKDGVFLTWDKDGNLLKSECFIHGQLVDVPFRRRTQPHNNTSKGREE